MRDGVEIAVPRCRDRHHDQPQLVPEIEMLDIDRRLSDTHKIRQNERRPHQHKSQKHKRLVVENGLDGKLRVHRNVVHARREVLCGVPRKEPLAVVSPNEVNAQKHDTNQHRLDRIHRRPTPRLHKNVGRQPRGGVDQAHEHLEAELGREALVPEPRGGGLPACVAAKCDLPAVALVEVVLHGDENEGKERAEHLDDDGLRPRAVVEGVERVRYRRHPGEPSP
mmetsp:Transcript_34097/g.66633  ORF Transcript_34097/g.66633 Transcript_34097/m.66633 type:complete len:223 (+) Transcript_34097:389-1057(+)